MYSEFMPEGRYGPSFLVNWKRNPYAKIGQIVHVEVDYYDIADDMIYLHGKNFDGYMSKNELSIYGADCYLDSKTPKFVFKALADGLCLTVLIIGFDKKNNMFVFSRKETMQKALSRLECGQTIIAYKMGATKNTIFLDIGAGINAIIPAYEVSCCKIPNIAEYFKDRDLIMVKLIGEGSYANKFIASYKQACTPKCIKEHDIVFGKTIAFTNDMTGIFVELSPLQAGIVDLEEGLLVVESEALAFLEPHIIIGREYPFWVKRIKKSKHTGELQYALRVIDFSNNCFNN